MEELEYKVTNLGKEGCGIRDIFTSLHKVLNIFDIRLDILRFTNIIDAILKIPVVKNNDSTYELFDTALLGCVMYMPENDTFWAKWVYNKLLWKKKVKDIPLDYIAAVEKIGETNPTARALFTIRLIFVKDSYDSIEEVVKERVKMQQALILLNSTIDLWINDSLLEPLFYNPIFSKIAAYNLTYHNCNNAFLLHQHGIFYKRMLEKLYENNGGLNRLVPVIKGPRKRIGFVSRFFFQHSVGKVATGIIEQLYKRNEFDIHVFTAIARPNDPYSQILVKNCTKYHGFDKEGQLQWIERIQAEKIDILVFFDPIMDINTYILACFQIAPIQIATWGHPETSGLQSIKYFVSSRQFEKFGDNNYTENLVMFNSLNMYYYDPNKFLSYNIRKMLSTCTKESIRATFNFPDVHIYAVTCPCQKISPMFEDAIIRILTDDPQGILVMTQDINPYHFKNIVRRFNQNMGSALCNRVYTVSFINDTEMFYKFIYCADVVLDPFPFGGLISTIDILSCGRSIVTLQGDKLYGRYTSGLYKAMGMNGTNRLVAQSVDEYVEKAITIASCPSLRTKIESEICDLLPNIFEDKATIDEWAKFLHTVT